MQITASVRSSAVEEVPGELAHAFLLDAPAFVYTVPPTPAQREAYQTGRTNDGDVGFA